MTGFSARSSSTSRQMTSEASALPPGELTRSTTALTFVVAHTGDLRGQRVAVNLPCRSLAVDDLAVGIDDGYLVGGNIFQIGADLRA